MSKIYGYVRVSTRQQHTERQIDNIKALYPAAIILTEKQSGKDIDGRPVFRRLLSKVKAGDTIVFDEVSRMSRNAEEGYNLYMDLMNKGISLVFIKERHIDTDEYKRRAQEHISKIQSDNKSIDNLINGMLDLIAQFERDNLRDNIRLAFDRAEQERLFLINRVTEGKAASDLPQGRPKGSRNINTDKADAAKQRIRELSKSFDGQFSDAKIMRDYLPLARNTYYKYKREMMQEFQSAINKPCC